MSDHAELRFEILGPVRVLRGDRELPVGPGKQRAVLAALLLNANRPTAPEHIVDTVWGDDPPDNGANVVQKYVGGLRRVLEPDRQPRAQGEIIVRTDAGYVLRVEPHRLDAEDFRHRVRQATAARADGRLDQAAAWLRSAEALWRSQALAGLPGQPFDRARDRLAGERAAALETWAEIELELGHHQAVLPELTRLVSEFPLREPLRHHLMLALYRSGRPAEALAAFEDARRYLDAELGIQPGEPLRQLHLRILRSDPPLAPRSDSPPHREPAEAPPSDQALRRWPPMLLETGLLAIGFGALSWLVFGYLAISRRSWPLGLSAAGYLVLLVVVIVLLGEPASITPARDLVAMLALLLAWGGGVTHAVLLGTGPRGRPRPPGKRWLGWPGTVAAIAVPLASLGMLTWAAFAYLALWRNSRLLAAAAFGYFALLGVIFVAITVELSAEEFLVSVAVAVTMLVGAVHAAIVALTGHDRIVRLS